MQVQPGEGLLEIVDRFDDDTVDIETVMAENGLATDVLEPFQLLDVCVDNGLNDIDGSTRTERNAVLVRREVEVQQAKLNELFAGYGIRELLVDGVSGPVTRQRLCAFRLAAGLPVSTADMAAGSEEEQVLMSTETLPIPFTSALLADRWVLIDETCQIMFVGEGTERLQFVFPTSTGTAEFDTRSQNRSRGSSTTRRATTAAGTTARATPPPRTIRSTATCTSRCTSTAGKPSMERTTCPAPRQQGVCAAPCVRHGRADRLARPRRRHRRDVRQGSHRPRRQRAGRLAGLTFSSAWARPAGASGTTPRRSRRHRRRCRG
ncbi:MAG: hypothetical protein R2697_06440 [Ilumatobacteraceae bacterium]